ncbi:hypothetical protein D3C71_1458840 [compost metagenome]
MIPTCMPRAEEVLAKRFPGFAPLEKQPRGDFLQLMAPPADGPDEPGRAIEPPPTTPKKGSTSLTGSQGFGGTGPSAGGRSPGKPGLVHIRRSGVAKDAIGTEHMTALADRSYYNASEMLACE